MANPISPFKEKEKKKEKYFTILEDRKWYHKIFEYHIFKVILQGGEEPFQMKTLMDVSDQYTAEKGFMSFLS